MIPTDDRLQEFLDRAKKSLDLAEKNNQDRISLWEAYVTVEYAILDLKLRYGLEQHGEKKKKASRIKLEENFNKLVQSVKNKIDAIDPVSSNKKKLLEELRSCRDVLKAMVAKSN